MNGDMGGGGEAGRDRLEIDNMFLDGSRFTRVSLKGAEFRDSHLSEAVLDDVNAAGLSVANANLAGASFHDVNLSDVRIDHANLSGLAINDANLTGMTIDGILVSDMVAAYKAAHPDVTT